jgi:uncharacterized protein YjiS (DUF1127 family)
MACGSTICSYPLDLSRFSEPVPADRIHRIRPGQWLVAIVRMHERWRQRQALMELDDRMLADIGISRDEMMAEVTKPFWK